MIKALIAFVATFVCGWVGMIVGLEFLGGFAEFGCITSVAVMGAFVIYFNEKRK